MYSLLSRWKLGDIYEGQWDQGLPHGDGKLEQAKGDRYEGHFEHGQREGLIRFNNRL